MSADDHLERLAKARAADNLPPVPADARRCRVNDGPVPRPTCTCVECDPAQTGAVRATVISKAVPAFCSATQGSYICMRDHGHAGGHVFEPAGTAVAEVQRANVELLNRAEAAEADRDRWAARCGVLQHRLDVIAETAQGRG